MWFSYFLVLIRMVTMKTFSQFSSIRHSFTGRSRGTTGLGGRFTMGLTLRRWEWSLQRYTVTMERGISLYNFKFLTHYQTTYPTEYYLNKFSNYFVVYRINYIIFYDILKNIDVVKYKHLKIFHHSYNSVLTFLQFLIYH